MPVRCVQGDSNALWRILVAPGIAKVRISQESAALRIRQPIESLMADPNGRPLIVTITGFQDKVDKESMKNTICT